MTSTNIHNPENVSLVILQDQHYVLKFTDSTHNSVAVFLTETEMAKLRDAIAVIQDDDVIPLSEKAPVEGDLAFC